VFSIMHHRIRNTRSCRAYFFLYLTRLPSGYGKRNWM
jgi:hypothetical protein